MISPEIDSQLAPDQIAGRELEQQLAFRIQLDQLVLEQSTLLFRSIGGDIDSVIRETLGRIGHLLDVDRAYVFRFSDSDSTMSNTHEWCAVDVVPQIDELQALPQLMFPQWMRQLRAGAEILIADVSALPDDWQAERDVLAMQGIHSVLVLPVAVTGRLLGFVGFDAVRPGYAWRAESRQMLQHFANNIGAVWTHEEVRQGMVEAMQVADELVQREQAANLQKSAFLSNISHEIRSPMNAVTGLAHLLLETPLDAVQRRYVEGIWTGGQSILKIINHVLDLSQIESGNVALHPVPFRLTSLMRDLQAVFGVQAAARGLLVEFSIASGTPDALVGDMTRISQILTNLLANAIKFSSQGTVRLDASLLARSAETCILQLVVSDQGIGMRDEEIERVFQPYWQSRASLRTEQSGSGLGLAITRQLTELMGGTVTVESQPGNGSRFSVRLPLTLDTAIENREPSIGAAMTGPHFAARMLVVEDIEINREIVVQILSRMGITADTAADGAEALARVREQPYDAVLMDVQMPVMDGLEATRRIRALGGASGQLPIIALTAHALQEEQQQCLDAGMNDLLTKPFNPRQLALVLARWLPEAGR